jgi:hypothetical protein
MDSASVSCSLPIHPWWHLPVGVFAILAGLTAVLMALRGDLSRREKIIWIIAVSLLTVGELRMIVWSDHDSEKNRAYAQCLELQQFQGVLQTEHKHFDATTAALKESYQQSQQQFSATMQGISNEINTFTGDHSYLVFYYVPGMGFIAFYHRGDYTVFDARARITDINEPIRPGIIPGTVVDVGEVMKGRSAIFPVPTTLNRTGNAANFNIFFTARNGGWDEQLRVRRKKGGWTYAIRVQGIFSDLKKGKVICESIEKDFPIATLDKGFNDYSHKSKLPPCWP